MKGYVLLFGVLGWLMAACSKENTNITPQPTTYVQQEIKALNLIVNPAGSSQASVSLNGKSWVNGLSFQYVEGPSVFYMLNDPDTVYSNFGLRSTSNDFWDSIPSQGLLKTGKYTVLCYGSVANASRRPAMRLLNNNFQRPIDMSANVRFFHAWPNQDTVSVRLNGVRICKLGYGQLTDYFNLSPSSTDQLLILNSSNDTLYKYTGEIFPSNQNTFVGFTYTSASGNVSGSTRYTILKRSENG